MSRSQLIVGLAVALTLAHFLWLSSWVVTGFTGPDADGYFAQARMLAFEGQLGFTPESRAQHIGIHWLEKPDGSYVGRYPVGFPVMLAATWRTLGRAATFYLNPLFASLACLSLFLLARRWIGDWPALAIAIVQGADAVVNARALQHDSHTSTTWCLATGLLFLDRWEHSGRRWFALAAGLLLGMVPAIRYAEVAAGVGVALFLAFALRRPERRPQIPWALAGALIPVGGTLVYNHIQFGAFWETAYSLSGESDLSLSYFSRNWPDYTRLLLTSGVGLFFPVALAGFAVMLRRRESRPLGAALVGIALPVTLLYCVYYSEGDGPNSIRFLLPTLPLYLVAGAYFLCHAVPGRTGGAALAGLAAFQALFASAGASDLLRQQRELSERSAIAISWLENNVAEGAVLIGQHRLAEVLHFTGQWKLADGTLLGLPADEFFEDDGTLSPEQLGKAVDLRRRYFEAPAEKRPPMVLHDLKKWADGAPIYWIAPETLEPTLPAEHVAYIPMTPPVELQSLDEIGLYKDFGDTTEPRFGLAAERLAVYRMETTTAPPERTSADRGK